MAKYRKKPVVIEAIQFTGDNKEEIYEWEKEQRKGYHFVVRDGYCFINTLEGQMRAKANDWIIMGVKGEFYPCKPDIFEATYEKV